MDSQTVEMLGRGRLVEELLRAGLEMALPGRDRGVDLIAYADLGPRVRRFVARPIQMKAATREHFSLDEKYAKFPPEFILAFVWNLEDPGRAVTYALSYREILRIARRLGWTRTESWRARRLYGTSRPGRRIKEMLEAHRMTPERWWRLVVEGR